MGAPELWLQGDLAPSRQICSAMSAGAHVALSDAEQPLLEKSGERQTDSQTVRKLLQYSAADTPLLLFAFAAGELLADSFC